MSELMPFLAAFLAGVGVGVFLRVPLDRITEVYVHHYRG